MNEYLNKIKFLKKMCRVFSCAATKWFAMLLLGCSCCSCRCTVYFCLFYYLPDKTRKRDRLDKKGSNTALLSNPHILRLCSYMCNLMVWSIFLIFRWILIAMLTYLNIANGSTLYSILLCGDVQENCTGLYYIQ